MTALLYLHSYRHRHDLDLDTEETADVVRNCWTYSGIAAVALLSLVAAVMLPTQAIAYGVPGWIYFVCFLVSWQAERRWGVDVRPLRSPSRHS